MSGSLCPSARLIRIAVAALGTAPPSSRATVRLLTPAADARDAWVWPRLMRQRAKCESGRGPCNDGAGAVNDMGVSMNATTSHKRQHKDISELADLAFADNRIASAVALTFVRSDRFWEAVGSAGDPSTAALDLVPCEGIGRQLICRYIECARSALSVYPSDKQDRRASAGFHVINMGLTMVWGESDPPLTSRGIRGDRPPSRHPSFAQYGRDPKPDEVFTSPLETLGRILARKCAVAHCNYPAQGVGPGRLSNRAVCCKDHESFDGDRSRRRVRRLLSTAAAIVGDPDDDLGEWLSDRAVLPAAPVPNERIYTPVFCGRCLDMGTVSAMPGGRAYCCSCTEDQAMAHRLTLI